MILTQIKYINDLLQKHGTQHCSQVFTPIMEAKLKKASDGYICEPQTLKDYETLLGGIMHLIVKNALIWPILFLDWRNSVVTRQINIGNL